MMHVCAAADVEHIHCALFTEGSEESLDKSVIFVLFVHKKYSPYTHLHGLMSQDETLQIFHLKFSIKYRDSSFINSGIKGSCEYK